METDPKKAWAKELAKDIVLHCFRNTFLEDLHSGIVPSSKTGDYSDVKVVTPYGEIPWVKMSRFGDEEMKKLIIETVNLTYTFLLGISQNRFKESYLGYMGMMRSSTKNWDEPQIVKEMLKNEKRPIQRHKARPRVLSEAPRA